MIRSRWIAVFSLALLLALCGGFAFARVPGDVGAQAPAAKPIPPVAPPPATGKQAPAACPTAFADLPSNAPDYAAAMCVVCRDVLDAYPCGGPGEPCNANNDPYFRPTYAHA